MQVTEVTTDCHGRKTVTLGAVGWPGDQTDPFAHATFEAVIDEAKGQGVLRAGRYFWVEFTRVKEGPVVVPANITNTAN